MPKILMKVSFFLAVLLLLSAWSTSNASANNGNKGKNKKELAEISEIAEINEHLEVLVEEINEKLQDGDTSAEVSVTTEDGGTLTLGVGPSYETEWLNGEIPAASKLVDGQYTTASSSVKNYSAFIGYKGIGLDFSHKVNGTYQTSSGKVGNVTYAVNQTGWAYFKSHTTSVQTSSSAMKLLTSRGYFTGMTIPFKQYVASLDIKFYGSANYVISLARID